MSEQKPYSISLRAKTKDDSPETLAAVDAAGERIGFTVASPAEKPKRGAPVRVTRQNPRRVSVELDGEDFKRLQMLGVERGEKLQTMCEAAILAYINNYLRK